MKFTTTIATLTTLLATTLAAPIEPYNGAQSIHPTTLSQYSVWTGATNYATAWGRIFKSGHESDVTTLVTFDFPAWTAGHKCELAFSLDSSATVTGSGQFDVFTSLAPATGSTTTWPSGNLRDQYLGRAQAVNGGYATAVDGYGSNGVFDCPAGRRMAGELVGVNDVVEIKWNGGVAGPYIIVSP